MDEILNYTSSSDSMETVPPDIDKDDEDDDRIVCTNSRSLDTILQIAVDHVKDLAKSQNLGSCESEFVSRFSEVFKNTLQENVTVNGLPWVVNKESLSSHQKEEQKNETNDALLSKLSKMVEVTANKRRCVPRECRRIYSMKLKHERHNLRMVNIESLDHFPPMVSSSKPVEIADMSPTKLTEVLQDFNSTIANIKTQMDDLQRIRKDNEFANDIMNRQKPHLEVLHDTGYNSE